MTPTNWSQWFDDIDQELRGMQFPDALALLKGRVVAELERLEGEVNRLTRVSPLDPDLPRILREMDTAE